MRFLDALRLARKLSCNLKHEHEDETKWRSWYANWGVTTILANPEGWQVEKAPAKKKYVRKWTLNAKAFIDPKHNFNTERVFIQNMEEERVKVKVYKLGARVEKK